MLTKTLQRKNLPKETVSLTIRIDPKLHSKLKFQAFMGNISLASIIETALTQFAEKYTNP